MLLCNAIAAALATASPGAVVATGPITCPAIVRVVNRSYGGVTLDATGATFAEGMALANVSGLTIRGGTFGTAERDTAARYAVTITGAADVSVAGASFIAGPSGDRGGLQFRNSIRVTARDNTFTGHRTGLSLYELTDFLAARNRFTAATSDGINSVGNQRGIIAANSCFWTVRVGLAHPDCIQLWSLPDKPLQSDVWVVNNSAVGMMQGILSSDPKLGSGRRLFFHGNYVAVTFSHTVTCGACVESVATDNVLASYPGSLFGIGRLKGFEHASNVTARNVMRDGTVQLPARVWWLGTVPIAGTVGSAFDDRSHAPEPVAVEVK